MQIDFNIADIRATSLKSVEPFLCNQRELNRIHDKGEDHYRTFKWLSWYVNNLQILDLGTRAGTSAICLADNPSNRVISVDINKMYTDKNNVTKDIATVLEKRNIKFIHSTVEALPDKILWRSPIISLDISHDGYQEREFLARLTAIKYDGIVIMDDIDFPRKFSRLQRVWKEIPEPTVQLPRSIAHATGLGIVIYGQHTINIV